MNSRREIIKWTTPIIVSVALPSHAQTSLQDTASSVPDPSPTGNVVISQILWRQTASADPNVLVDEYIEIRNDDSVPIQLDGWTIEDAAIFSFTFSSRVLQPGETCRVFSHAPQGANTWSCEATFGRTSPGSSGNYIWNNTGDTATLTDSTSSVVDTCAYDGADPSPYPCP